MNARLRQRVRRRARDRCEYCGLHQRHDALPHHVDHIIARKHRGATTSGNLALACASCSLRKGPNIAGHDPATGKLTRLFHPRNDEWAHHFRWKGPLLLAMTAIGRTTIAVLDVNDPDRVELRRILIGNQDFPFPGPT